MATVTTIPALDRFGVIIAGGVVPAREAVERWVGSIPMRNVHLNGYGSVHADVFATREQIDAWWDASHERGPGALLFFLGKERVVMPWLSDEELEQAFVEEHLDELELSDTQRALEAEADERDAALSLCEFGEAQS